ncbi:MAG: ZIP family metal transporter [Firmicutes bacterium]|nr:ZIP family metal transporter [Bacillota bacterium]
MFIVVVASLLMAAVSLGGGCVLLFADKKMGKSESVVSNFVTAFAAGALLATAFVDIIPEAMDKGAVQPRMGAILVLCGLVFFFLLEGVFHGFHSHSHGQECSNCEHINSDKCGECEHEGKEHHHSRTLHNVMLAVGGALHNLLDGVAIGAAFLVSVNTGVLVTLVILAHEIPHELSNFAIMQNNGTRKRTIILVNLGTSLLALLSAVVIFALGKGEGIDFPVEPALLIVAGFFVYIATTDIIPTIHQEHNRKHAVAKMGLLVLGALVVGALIVLLER